MNKLEEFNEDLYLLIVIHSLDMGQLKQAESLDALAQIASCKGVRMVVTIDNCKASVLFNDRLLDLFNFAVF